VRALLLFVFLAAGCYETPRPECAFHCGPEGDCPEGYGCQSDGWCKRVDVPDDFECAPPVPDAAPIPDAGPDAGVDAAVPDAGEK
jgi:hypothetical protein